jgi:hypothetical protein
MTIAMPRHLLVPCYGPANSLFGPRKFPVQFIREFRGKAHEHRHLAATSVRIFGWILRVSLFLPVEQGIGLAADAGAYYGLNSYLSRPGPTTRAEPKGMLPRWVSRPLFGLKCYAATGDV